ncbi:MAG: membrane or secreted protein [Bacteroidota bacterium]|nr:membrane or secreted protein [Bacteroidota bacterium]
MLQTIIGSFIILSLVIFGMAIRIVFQKNGEFRGGCASNNPMLRNELGECTLCGKSPEDCDDPEESTLPKIG